MGSDDFIFSKQAVTGMCIHELVFRNTYFHTLEQIQLVVNLYNM